MVQRTGWGGGLAQDGVWGGGHVIGVKVRQGWVGEVELVAKFGRNSEASADISGNQMTNRNYRLATGRGETKAASVYRETAVNGRGPKFHSIFPHTPARFVPLY